MNNRFEEAIKQMEEMILSLKEKASAKLESISEDDGNTVKALTDKTVNAINTTINKVKEIAGTQASEEDFNSFLEKVVNKCNEAAAYTAGKIEAIKDKVVEAFTEEEPVEETVKEAETEEPAVEEAVAEEVEAEEVDTEDEKPEIDLSKIKEDIKEGLDKLMENENVQNFANALKDLSSKIQNYLNSPEIQSKIDKAKDTTIDIAEKGLDVLRNVLKTDEAVKDEDDDIVYFNKED